MANTVYTIGHSTHTFTFLADLLRLHDITAICDVRSTPYSRLNPQFNREDFKEQLRAIGMAYVFLGKELGARSDDPGCYINGKVQYGQLAQTDGFKSGLERIKQGSVNYRLALICAEKEPLECHRSILVGRAVEEQLTLSVTHIHANGTLETHSDAMLRLAQMFRLRAAEHHMFHSTDAVFAEAYSLEEDRIAYVTRPQQARALRSYAR